MSGKSSSMFRGSILILFSLALSGTLSFVLSIVISRSVSVEEFGIYTLITSVQAVVLLFSGFGIGGALSKFIPEYRARGTYDVWTIFRNGVFLTAIFSGISCSVYLVTAERIGMLLHETRISDIVPYSVLVVLSGAFFYTVYGTVQGFQEMALLANLRILVSIMGVVFVAVLVLPYGVEGALIGLSIAQALIMCAGTVFLRRIYKKAPAREPIPLFHEVNRGIMSFSVPAVLSSLLLLAAGLLGNSELALKAGFKTFGFFSVALVFYNGLIIPALSMSITLVPRVAELSITSPEKMRTLVGESVRSISLWLLPMTLLVGLLSESLVRLIFGTSYDQASEMILVMALASYYYSIVIVLGAAIIGSGRLWSLLSLNAVWASTFLVSLFSLVPNWGAAGLTATFTLSYGLSLVLFLVLVKRVLKTNLAKSYTSIALTTSLFAVGIFGLSDLGGFGAMGKLFLLVLAIVIPMRLDPAVARKAMKLTVILFGWRPGTRRG